MLYIFDARFHIKTQRQHVTRRSGGMSCVINACHIVEEPKSHFNKAYMHHKYSETTANERVRLGSSDVVQTKDRYCATQKTQLSSIVLLEYSLDFTHAPHHVRWKSLWSGLLHLVWPTGFRFRHCIQELTFPVTSRVFTLETTWGEFCCRPPGSGASWMHLAGRLNLNLELSACDPITQDALQYQL